MGQVVVSQRLGDTMMVPRHRSSSSLGIRHEVWFFLVPANMAYVKVSDLARRKERSRTAQGKGASMTWEVDVGALHRRSRVGYD